jgi:phage terminase large subunit-like protein
VPSYRWNDDTKLTSEQLQEVITPYLVKLGWFAKHGYQPHYWQALFHCNTYDGHLTRRRHLVAGRRGGKTLSAAWEVLFYLLNPEFFHLDAHGKVIHDRPLWAWALAKDNTVGFASKYVFRQCLTDAGLIKGKDYNENRTEGYFEFPNGSRIDFKSADDPERLRGAGLDILWIDEAAFIPNERAWEVVRPALTDRQGLVITTTTPDGKNWFYDEFWSDKSFESPLNGRVEYTSINNPYFPREEWEAEKLSMHPLLFKMEYMAAFDSMAGKELSGDWLHYYGHGDLENKGGRWEELDRYIGVDPAISLADKADRFVMTLVGVNRSTGQAYILEQYADRIPFPDQVDKIREWHLQYRPQLIGIESVAYQAALVQQVKALESLPPVIPILAREKKSLRILSMSPLFKIRKILIRKEHRDFIDEWIDYDTTLKNPKDDCLDSAEIALRTAGALLPIAGDPGPNPLDYPAVSMQERANRAWPGNRDEDHPSHATGIGEW